MSDRALPHLQNVEGYKGNRFAGISGGHDMNSLLTYIHEQLPHLTDDPDELIVSRTEHPTIQGIYNIYYRVPKQDGKGNFTGEYKTFSQPKTVYDPAVLSPQQISNWAMGAFTGQGAVIEGYTIRGVASNGLRFVGYLDGNNQSVLKN